MTLNARFILKRAYRTARLSALRSTYVSELTMRDWMNVGLNCHREKMWPINCSFWTKEVRFIQIFAGLCCIGGDDPPSWSSIRSFTWQGLETSFWSSSRALDRPTPQRHWICSCQPLETGHPTVLRGHGGATRRPELAMRWRRRRRSAVKLLKIGNFLKTLYSVVLQISQDVWPSVMVWQLSTALNTKT